MKYQVSVSGRLEVEVEANSPNEAEEKALNDTIAGELYDWVVEDVKEKQ